MSSSRTDVGTADLHLGPLLADYTALWAYRPPFVTAADSIFKKIGFDCMYWLHLSAATELSSTKQLQRLLYTADRMAKVRATKQTPTINVQIGLFRTSVT